MDTISGIIYPNVSKVQSSWDEKRINRHNIMGFNLVQVKRQRKRDMERDKELDGQRERQRGRCSLHSIPPTQNIRNKISNASTIKKNTTFLFSEIHQRSHEVNSKKKIRVVWIMILILLIPRNNTNKPSKRSYLSDNTALCL